MSRGRRYANQFVVTPNSNAALSDDQRERLNAFLQHKLASHLTLTADDIYPTRAPGQWRPKRICNGICNQSAHRPYRHDIQYHDVRCHARGVCATPYETWRVARARHLAEMLARPTVTIIVAGYRDTYSARDWIYRRVAELPPYTTVVHGFLVHHPMRHLEKAVNLRDDLYSLEFNFIDIEGLIASDPEDITNDDRFWRALAAHAQHIILRYCGEERYDRVLSRIREEANAAGKRVDAWAPSRAFEEPASALASGSS